MLIETNRTLRGHDFLPNTDIIRSWPKLYATEDIPSAEKLIVAHYFLASADWFIVELDAEEGMAFGWACLTGRPTIDGEWGYISLPELEQLRVAVPFTLRDAGGRDSDHTAPMVVERDLDWTPRRASEVLPPTAVSFG